MTLLPPPTAYGAERRTLLTGRRAALVLTTLAVVWVGIVLLAPVALAHGYGVLPAIIYQLAGPLCHQRPERSFHLAGIQLPVCARCFGLYAAGAGGAVAAFCAAAPIGARGFSRHESAVLALAATPTVVTVVGEWGNLLHPDGLVRAAAAVPLGLAAGWLCVRALRSEG